MKPFLLLATRAEDEAADGEYRAFLDAGGLARGELVRVRLEAAPMPEVDLRDYSGVIVGGSPFNSSDAARDKTEVQRRVEREFSALLSEIVATDFPFLGACYGIGLLGTHLGGVIDRRYSEPVGPSRIELTAAAAFDPIFGVLDPGFDAFVGHKEACSVLPPGAVLLATSDRCPVQAFRIGANVYATQFHPELTVDGIVTRIRVYRDYGYFSPHAMDALITKVRSVTVTEPGRVVAAFVDRHATR